MKTITERLWLNPKKGLAAVQWEVTDYSSLEINDCRRGVSLEFPTYSRSEFTASKRKIRRLIESLERFEKAFFAQGVSG